MARLGLCATILCLLLPVANLASAAQAAFTLVDARPDVEKTTHTLSDSIWSCDFGVYALGDDLAREQRASPRLDRIVGLKADLARGLGDRLAGRTLTVDHYNLYLNLTASQAGVAPDGPLGALMAPQAQTREAKCPRDKMTAGWFDGAELSTPYPPYIVEMEVELDGQHHKVRAVVSTQKDVAQLDIIQAAFAQANAALIAELARQLP
jgi:hypothetical protein